MFERHSVAHFEYGGDRDAIRNWDHNIVAGRRLVSSTKS